MAEVPVVSEQQQQQVSIVCESTSCIPAELVQRLGIGVVPIPFVFGSTSYLDGIDISASEFYERLVQERTPPKTSPPSPGAYLDAWTQAAGGPSQRAVVLVTVSTKVSTLQRSAVVAQETARTADPPLQVTIVDSRSAGMGQGFVALAAARTAQQGGSLEQVVAVAEETAGRVKTLVALDTLDYLGRSAHLPDVAAWAVGLLDIKPIIELADGVRLAGRVRTRRRSLERLVEMACEQLPADKHAHIAVQHARAAEEAAEMAERFREARPDSEILVTEFTPVMGGYCGPGLVGAAFFADA